MTRDPLPSCRTRSSSWTRDPFLDHVIRGSGSPSTTGQTRVTLPDVLTAWASFSSWNNILGGTEKHGSVSEWWFHACLKCIALSHRNTHAANHHCDTLQAWIETTILIHNQMHVVIVIIIRRYLLRLLHEKHQRIRTPYCEGRRLQPSSGYGCPPVASQPINEAGFTPGAQASRGPEQL